MLTVILATAFHPRVPGVVRFVSDVDFLYVDIKLGDISLHFAGDVRGKSLMQHRVICGERMTWKWLDTVGDCGYRFVAH
jgi:hypothetical protein